MVGANPKSIAIGRALKRAREDVGISARALSIKMGLSHTTIGRWESGVRIPRPVDVAAVLAALGSDSGLREDLVELARDVDEAHWIAIDLPDRAHQLTALLDVERDAQSIVSVAPTIIPGLLQTSDYARAIIGSSGGGVPSNEVETRVRIRVGRREILTRPRRPVEYLVIIDESVLHRAIGGREILVDQLRSLLEVARLPNVELRLIPNSSDWHPGLEGPFHLIKSKQATIVHVENRRSGLFFHKDADVEAYETAVRTIMEIAMAPDDSTGHITQLIKTMEISS